MAFAKSVISKEDAEKIVVAYNPRKFPQTVSSMASQFIAFSHDNPNAGTSHFKIDQIVAQQTGIAELERLSIEEQVERDALERIKDLQEQAYTEAYSLGLDEGREKAFEEKKSEFEQKLLHFESLISSVETLKSDLIASNETQILRLVTHMVKRLVFDEVKERPELILEVVRRAIESAQSDESIVVKVSPSDMVFLEETRGKLGKEFDSLQRAKFESSESIKNGGCIVETNYGDIDATMEQRFERLWAAISEKLPKVKNVVGE